MRHMGEPGALEELSARVGKVTPGGRGKWGKMSSHEMVCHLSDAYRFALGRKAASDATGVFQRTVMKWFALNLPVPWPRGVGTRPEMEQGKGGTPPLEFEGDRRELLVLMGDFARQQSFAMRHPIFGQMKRTEWMRWGYLHADHHLRQFGA